MAPPLPQRSNDLWQAAATSGSLFASGNRGPCREPPAAMHALSRYTRYLLFAICAVISFRMLSFRPRADATLLPLAILTAGGLGLSKVYRYNEPAKEIEAR